MAEVGNEGVLLFQSLHSQELCLLSSAPPREASPSRLLLFSAESQMGTQW